jgi:hypothetical protein
LVGARRRQFHCALLHTNRSGQRRETQIERRQLRLGTGLLLLVCEYLANTIARRIGIVGKPDFIVSVIGDTAPEAKGINDGIRGAPFASGRELGLMRIDPGVVVLSVNSRNVIERVVVNDCEAQKSSLKI